jgi:hypothetical protein
MFTYYFVFPGRRFYKSACALVSNPILHFIFINSNILLDNIKWQRKAWHIPLPKNLNL